MGSFSNAVSIAASHMNISISIDAYEANPSLIFPLLHNFKIYNSNVLLHWNAVGSTRSSMELVVPQGGAIGGSLLNPESRKIGNYFSCLVNTIPLSECIPTSPNISIIKMDIEGYEVPAFSSLIGDPALLDNIFIVEFSPSQASQQVAPDILYADFLFKWFQVFNIGNWAWFHNAVQVHSVEDLSTIDLANSACNTDLLLIPRRLNIDAILG
jgi:FkbM family methyltransferase